MGEIDIVHGIVLEKCMNLKFFDCMLYGDFLYQDINKSGYHVVKISIDANFPQVTCRVLKETLLFNLDMHTFAHCHILSACCCILSALVCNYVLL